MGMYFKSPRVHLRCELAIACVENGSKLNSWGWISNPLEFIYAVNCLGLVGELGLA